VSWVRVRLAFVAAFALAALAVGVTLSGSPVVVAHTNGTFADGQIAETVSNAGACQSGEVLPAGISAIRLTIFSDAGPQVSLRALSGARVLTHGAVGSGWVGGSLTVPVRPISHTTSGVRLCFKLGPTREKVAMVGVPTSRAAADRSNVGEVLPGRIRVEYLRAGRSSWWSLARTVARRMGLGRAPSGAWIALLAIVLMGAGIAAASWVAIKELS
jgi:hypothetical protein